MQALLLLFVVRATSSTEPTQHIRKNLGNNHRSYTSQHLTLHIYEQQTHAREPSDHDHEHAHAHARSEQRHSDGDSGGRGSAGSLSSSAPPCKRLDLDDELVRTARDDIADGGRGERGRGWYCGEHDV